MCYLLFLWSLFKLSKWLRQNASPDDPEAVALALGFTVSTICVYLGQIYGSPVFEGSVMGLYWALCGLLERYIQLKMVNQPGVVVATEAPTLADRFPLAKYTS